jgi:hypothetical protein
MANKAMKASPATRAAAIIIREFSLTGGEVLISVANAIHRE